MSQPKNLEEAYKDAEESLSAVIFCIEIFATYKKWLSSKAYQILKESGVLHEFIIPHWWVLHTQSNEEVCESIDKILKNRDTAMDNFKTVYHGSIIGEGLKTKYLERLLLNLKEENNYSLDVAIDKVYLSGVDKILESEELFVSPLRKIKQILSL